MYIGLGGPWNSLKESPRKHLRKIPKKNRATPSSLATTSVRVTRRVVKVAVPPMRAVRQQVSKGVACSVPWITANHKHSKTHQKIGKELAHANFN